MLRNASFLIADSIMRVRAAGRASGAIFANASSILFASSGLVLSHRSSFLLVASRIRWRCSLRSISRRVSQYPNIAPPAISITATYPGASAKTLEDTVTQVIEQKMNGIDHLRYAGRSDLNFVVNGREAQIQTRLDELNRGVAVGPVGFGVGDAPPDAR